MSRPVRPVRLWVAVVRNHSGNEHIHHHTVARLRRESRRLYLEQWDPAYYKDALSRVRFARVIVALEKAPDHA